MIFRRDPTKALQMGFLAVLAVATAQVAWWIADQRWLAWGEHDRLAALYEADATAATAAFHALGDRWHRSPTPDTDRQALANAFGELPHLVIDPVAGIASVRAEAVETLASEAGSRVNRYAWEGGFFLLVLLFGMAVLTRAIRHDADLRRRQQNFIAAVSHEFKSPLASMRLSAETLARRSAEADSRRLGDRLVEDGDRLLRMVDNLLDTARIDDGRIVLGREPTSLRAVVHAARAEHLAQAANAGVDIRADVPDFPLDADPFAIESVLRNLLDNAVKACIAGGGESITIEAERNEGVVDIVIADDGVGFPPRDAAMIFEKFYRAGDETNSPMPGTGLGLYLVRRLAELSDARVVATSDGPGRGARITVSWPATRS